MASTILLVDDSGTIRSLLKVYLASLRADFLDAEDGERALQVLRLVQVDLVIADVRMAPMDGITFVGQIRASKQERVRSLPVILLTGARSEELRRRGLAAGANAFVYKPVDEETLLIQARDLLKLSLTRPA
jgi:CheY-like chemotaxis protein